MCSLLLSLSWNGPGAAPLWQPHTLLSMLSAQELPCVDRVKRCVFEEEGSLPSLEPRPQLSKGLRGRFSASLCAPGAPPSLSPPPLAAHSRKINEHCPLETVG